MMRPRSFGMVPLKLLSDRFLRMFFLLKEDVNWLTFWVLIRNSLWVFNLQVCQAAQVSETRRDRSIEAVTMNISANQENITRTKANTLQHWLTYAKEILQLIQCSAWTYVCRDWTFEVIIGKIPENIWNVSSSQFSLSYKKKDDQWRGLESHTSNNWSSFPSSEGILPESWLSFNCLQCRKRLQPLYLQSQKILSEKQETMNRLTLPSILQVAELWHVAKFGRNWSSELVPMQIPAQRSNGSK